MAYPKSLKRVKACPVHQACYEEAIRILNTGAPAFGFHQVIHNLKFQLMQDSINWARIREWLEETGVVLTPVAEPYFTMPLRKRQALSEASKVKFVCIGHGKKAAGYARPFAENGELAILWADQKVKITNGSMIAAKDYTDGSADEADALQPGKQQTKRLASQRAKLSRMKLLPPVDPPPPPPPPGDDDDEAA